MIESLEHGEHGPVLRYRRPDDPRTLRTVQVWLVLAIISSLYSLWAVVSDARTLYDFAVDLRHIVLSDGAMEAPVQDGVRLLAGAILFAEAGVAVAAVALPIRYALLFKAAPAAHPRTYTAIKLWAAAMLGVEVLRGILYLALIDQYETIELYWGPTPNMLLGAWMLWYMGKDRVRALFSTYTVLGAD